MFSPGVVFFLANGLFVITAGLTLVMTSRFRRARRTPSPHRSAGHRQTPADAVLALPRRGSLARMEAAEYLGLLQCRDAVPSLCALLGDPDQTVRMVAARALGRIGGPAAVAPLLGTLAQNRIPQQAVADALVRLGRPARPRLVAALGESQPQARAVVVEVLGLLGATEAIPHLVLVLRHDPVLEVKIRAARALGRIGTLTAFGPLLDAARPDQSQALRAVAAQSLGQLGDPAAMLRLSLLLSDEDYWVARNAAGALVRLGEAGIRALRNEVRHGTVQAASHAREALAVHALRRETADTAV